jgi:uncharacterized protein (TIGR02265 family)
MSAKRLVFRSLLEALYERALMGEVTPELKARLKRLGLDLDLELPESLPVSIYRSCILATVEELFPEVPPAEGMRELATRLARGYWETPVGRAMLGLVRLLGPQRSLTWMSRFFRAIDSYSEIRIDVEGPGRFLVHSNAPDVPEGYGEGIFEEILRAAGADAPRVEQQLQDARSTVYRVEWTER